MNPYLRAANRLRTQAALKLEKRLEEGPVPVRARDKNGLYIEDDPSTPDVDEAWARMLN